MAKAGVPMVTVCPECDRPKITARKRKTPKYRCDACRARFEEPATRPSEQHTESKENLSATDRYDDIRAALRSLQRDGQSFVKSAHVADRVEDMDARDVGKVLATQGVDSGDVWKWREESTPTLWRISLDESKADTEATP